MRARILYPARLAGPPVDQPLDQLPDRKYIVLVRTEIPGAGKSCAFEKQLLRQGHVTTQAVQDELPGAHRLRVAQNGGPAFVEGIHHVGDELIVGPVSATDHIARTRAGDRLGGWVLV